MDPARWEADVVAADGGTVHVRPIRPDDGPRLLAFHDRQSAESIYFRFFSPRPRLSEADVAHFTTVDGLDRMAFVALLDDELIAVARYDRWPDRDDAEVAFFVDEAHKGRGLGTVLLEYLAVAAREAGIRAFVAHVLPSNRRMLGVFRQAGFDATSRFADGVVEVSFAIEATAGAQAAIDRRARQAEVRSVARLLEARSVAVVGASRDPASIGHAIVRQLLDHDLAGVVHPVNPNADAIAGVPAYRSVLDVPGPVDLAVVVVPAAAVVGVVEECAQVRIGGVIVISSGFAEEGPEGAAAQAELVQIVRRYGIRLLGPNSIGLINTAPDLRLHATFADVPVRPGPVALSTQSGALGGGIVARATQLGIGMSSVVSVGNKADVSGNDLLRYWEQDERTKAILLYLESFGNPRRFGRIAREVARSKPIVAVKSGRDPQTDTLLAQTGVIRVATLEQLLEVALVLATQPVPAGRRVAVLANRGGPARFTRDACAGAGLQLVDPAPVELTFDATPDDYGVAARELLQRDDVDALVVVFAPSLTTNAASYIRAIVAATDVAPEKPVVSSVLAEVPREAFVSPGGRTIPSFLFPDAGIHALGRVAGYGAWRAAPEGHVPVLKGTSIDDAVGIVASALAAAPEPMRLPAEDAHALLVAAGMPVLELRFAEDATAAAVAADAIGYPVALKATGLQELPKTEAAGLALDLHAAADVRHAFERMAARRPGAMRPAIVQRMSPPGRDVRVRVRHDDVVGVAVGVGPGGAAAEALADVDVRLVPVTDAGAEQLVESLAAVVPLYDAGRRALVDIVLRAAWLAQHVDDIHGIDLNPIIASDEGALVADAVVHVGPIADEPPPVRRLGR